MANDKNTEALREVLGDVDLELLADALTGKNLGDYRLFARPEPMRVVMRPIPLAPQLADRFIEASGYFEDRDEHNRGSYVRLCYRNRETKELEVWLVDMKVYVDRRGGMADFTSRTIDAFRRAGFRQARSNAGGLAGASILARRGFVFDEARLPRFGAGSRFGVAKGDKTRYAPLDGDLVGGFVRRVVDAACNDCRITDSEAAMVLGDRPRSMQKLLDYPERRLSRRLLSTVRFPALLEL